ncbi:amp-binding enzyme [Pyrenophora seminiperda CCB06]|uniref:Amp-binding enzyme n=1 Tax=Pyrenophora seminiperda CCB06 TaxID=1302712 RepID=A0A3M7M565_9PLEO|nr:amp-binding enzyme [Pyrenophora seminiperda CCB06]
MRILSATPNAHTSPAPYSINMSCPVIGTTNDVLPPNHPSVDLTKDGQTCPVVGAKTDHHHNLHSHPPVPTNDTTATSCPALKNAVNEPKAKEMDDALCPVVGTATTVLPPDHPDMLKASADDVCPVTKATVGHHQNKVQTHPSVAACLFLFLSSSSTPALKNTSAFTFKMSLNFTFSITPADQINETMLQQAATLFSTAYGVWSPEAEQKMGKYCKPGQRTKMSVDRLREQSLAPNTNSVLVRGMASEKLAGYAFATRWMYEGRQICWVTQLCVDHEYRGKKLATQLLLLLREGEQDGSFGILSSHPGAILAALRAWGRGIEKVDMNMVKEHSAGVMTSSPVKYVREAKLKGSVFGVVNDSDDGTVCCADTQFWVDHTEPLAAVAEVKKRGIWPFGELPDGCEFLVLVKGGQVNAGNASPPLLEQTVPQHFAGIVRQYGDRDAVISHHQRIRLTYDALDRDSNKLARGLQKLGVKKGDRVAVSLGNNAEFATLTYALFKIGAILVPLNPSFNGPQVLNAINHLNATLLVTGTETNSPRKDPRSNIPLLTHLIPNLTGSAIESELVPSLKNVVLVDNARGRIELNEYRSLERYENLMEDGASDNVLEHQGLSPQDIVNIQFTSGTTSLPKAACLTHRNILNNGKSIGDRILLTPNDVVCCPPPLFQSVLSYLFCSLTPNDLFSCFGCILGFMATATHGSAIVFPTEAFDAPATLEAVREYKCTALYGVPTMFVAELELLSHGAVPQEGFQHLRTGISAGSTMPSELMRKLHKNLNLTELTICYGMTETSPVSAMTTTDDPIEKRIDSVGRLLPHVQAKVVDPSDWSRILAVGERGELAVSGYLLMKGYWGDVARTEEVLQPDEDGIMWMHTGDEASMDEEGYIKITGRIKDLIIKGGENIHPLEVENCLFAHPAISEVSVVGLPDERYGEVVAAFVVKHEGTDGNLTADEVRSWVREKLSNHLVPKYVFWVDNYPKTASGKIQKFELKGLGIKLLQEGKGSMYK